MRDGLDRRDWLRTVGMAGLGTGLGMACGGSGSRRMGRVQVSEDRIVRTTVGLRPFRPGGFRLDAEALGTKTIIHNYGHGGGGMSLSWGCSHLAVDKALETGETDFGVIGCGVMGLSTARLLQKRGFNVTIYAKDLPPSTTSNMSAAWWGPSSVSNPSERTPGFTELYVKAARLAHRYFQDQVSDDYGVRWMERYNVSRQPGSGRQGPQRGLIDDLYPGTRELAAREHSFPWPHVTKSWTMAIEPAIYLNALLRDFRLAGGAVVVRSFEDREQLLALREPVLVNCTGIGARDLFGDETLVPIKGQLTVLLPQPELDYIMVGGGLYMIPRRDGVALGGTHERDEWSLEPSRTEMHRVMQGHTEFWGQMA